MAITIHMSLRNLHTRELPEPNPEKVIATFCNTDPLLVPGFRKKMLGEILEIFEEKVSDGAFTNRERLPHWLECVPCLVSVVLDPAVVSTALLLPVGTPDHHAKIASLEYVMTRKSHTGKGFAKATCLSLLHTAKKLGFERVILKCNPHTPDNLYERYTKWGFEEDYWQVQK